MSIKIFLLEGKICLICSHAKSLNNRFEILLLPTPNINWYPDLMVKDKWTIIRSGCQSCHKLKLYI